LFKSENPTTNLRILGKIEDWQSQEWEVITLLNTVKTEVRDGIEENREKAFIGMEASERD
jgi:hypothetical protein